MPKIFSKKRRAKYQKYSKWWRFGGAVIIMLMAIFMLPGTSPKASAAGCPDLKVIFARGSGGTRWEDPNYLTFKSAMMDKLALTHIDYAFEDLDYPAVSIASITTLLTTFVSGGEAYKFGESVAKGVEELQNIINSTECPNTRYMLGGYSQGAMVISKALPYLNADKIIYAATFGDPKLYLPEGYGAVPAACKGENLSNYRAYVPDCRAYSGMLGGYNPYQTTEYIDKLGAWCHKGDFFCSSHLNIGDHLAYTSDGIYAEASKTIFDKITQAFGIENLYVAPHDTAILIDSTWSMRPIMRNIKDNALELAEATLESGGRVALYDYRDLNDGYEPVEHCNFDTCTLETFKKGLEEINGDGGGDDPESLLGSSFQVMKKLNWQQGATKSLVVFTDDVYHDPDFDNTTLADVVRLSKEIDPVSFYVVLPRQKWDLGKEFKNLVEATGGAVTSAEFLADEMFEQIMARYDSLPRVEEMENISNAELPSISGTTWKRIDDNSMRVSWRADGTRTLVALNDAVLGVTESSEIMLEDLDFRAENLLTLVPLSETRRGTSVTVNLNVEPNLNAEPDVDFESSTSGSLEIVENVIIPKAPNTGRKSE